MIYIIGGGFTGLSAAMRLLERGQSVTVLEKGENVGGMVSYFRFFDNTEPLEYIYHHVFTSDKYLVELCEKLGIREKLFTYEPKDAMYIDGKFFPFTSPMDLIKFTPLKFFDRIRMGLTVLKAGRINDWSKLENQLASDWLLKNVGKSSYERVWKPLLKSKFADDYEKVSAVWIWNKFKLRGNTRGKDITKEQLGYFDGSFGRIAEHMADKIKKLGGNVICNADVFDIKKTDEGFSISYNDSFGNSVRTVTAEKVITALPGQITDKITKTLPLDNMNRKRLSAIDSKANICVTLLLKNPVSGYYWNTVCDEMPFVAMIEHTNLVKNKNYGGTVIYLSRYLNQDDKLYQNVDEKTIDIFESAFLKMFPSVKKDDILARKIYKTTYSQPVVVPDYSTIKPEIRSNVDGFYTISMAHIYPEDRGINYAIRSGYEAAEEALK